MASILLEERTLRCGTGSGEAQAGGGARIIETAARRLKRDGIHGPGIAALMAEAGLARRHRTAGRAAVRTGIIDYARTIIAGEHRRTASGSCGGRRSVWRGTGKNTSR